MSWRFPEWEVESVEFRSTPLELMRGEHLPVPRPVLVELPSFPGRRHVRVKVGAEVVADLIWTTDRLETSEVEHIYGLLLDAVNPKAGKLSLLP